VNQIVRYYPDADVLVIELGRGRVVDEELLDNDIVIGYNEDREVVRIEIHYASKRGLIDVLKEFARARRDVVEHILRATSVPA